MTVIRRKLGPNLWYYQYISLTTTSDKFYFAPGDEITRLDALREVRTFKRAVAASRKASITTWKNAQQLNRNRYVQIKEAPDEDLKCEVDFTLYEAGQ